ncbi:MAG: hypothetical protein A3E83_04155 [Gammaproteobacteria bacterium RIFCSPHIGHO2_12_FULL_41_20]|nr:MAG: hypothetical protein A3E83_04155 [Gammaproteobacteria bacterium RIFCSPHIGHO2_12_FULL_41_20]
MNLRRLLGLPEQQEEQAEQPAANDAEMQDTNTSADELAAAKHKLDRAHELVHVALDAVKTLNNALTTAPQTTENTSEEQQPAMSAEQRLILAQLSATTLSAALVELHAVVEPPQAQLFATLLRQLLGGNNGGNVQVVSFGRDGMFSGSRSPSPATSGASTPRADAAEDQAPSSPRSRRSS